VYRKVPGDRNRRALLNPCVSCDVDGRVLGSCSGLDESAS
jgi:hypothetical protein